MKEERNRRTLQRVSRKTKGAGIHHPLLAVDVENDPETGDFICAGIHGEIKGLLKGRKKIKRVEAFYDSQAELCEFLSKLRKGSCILVFFNLNYDKPFFDSIIDHNTIVECNGL